MKEKPPNLIVPLTKVSQFSIPNFCMNLNTIISISTYDRLSRLGYTSSFIATEMSSLFSTTFNGAGASTTYEWNKR